MAVGPEYEIYNGKNGSFSNYGGKLMMQFGDEG